LADPARVSRDAPVGEIRAASRRGWSMWRVAR